MILDLTISIFSAKCNSGFPHSRDCGAFCRNIAKENLPPPTSYQHRLLPRPSFLLPEGPVLTDYILDLLCISQFEIWAFLPQLASCNFKRCVWSSFLEEISIW